MVDSNLRSVRKIKRGDIVRTKEGTNEEVVREVSIVLSLSNGSNDVYASTDEIEVIPPENIPE